MKSTFATIRKVQVTAINDLCAIVNDWAEQKGWNEGEDSISHKAEQIALMHSELSECLEFLRKRPTWYCPKGCPIQADSSHPCTCGAKLISRPAMDDHVPELTGEAAELADVLIRIFHYCGKRSIDLGHALQLKHKYNITRPYRHGKNC